MVIFTSSNVCSWVAQACFACGHQLVCGTLSSRPLPLHRHRERLQCHRRGADQCAPAPRGLPLRSPISLSIPCHFAPHANTTKYPISKQVQQSSRADIEGVDLVLIGHSLGGLVSTYIAEHLTPQLGRPPKKHGDRLTLSSLDVRVRGLVCISAPIGGSEMLCWLRETLPRSFFPVPVLGIDPYQGIGRDFCPDAPVLAQLRSKLAASEKRFQNQLTAASTVASTASMSPLSRGKDDSRLYISGACDPLVRPSSALARANANASDTGYSRVLIHHCGHYSIIVSTVTWTVILKFVGQSVPHLHETLSD